MMSEKSLDASRFAEVASLFLAVFVVLLIGTISYSDARRIQIDRKDLRPPCDSRPNRRSDSGSADLGIGAKRLPPHRKARVSGSFSQSAANIREQVSALADSTAGWPEQHAEFGDLRQLVDGKLAELEETLQASRAHDPDAALAIVMSNRGLVLMEKIRISANKIGASSERRIAEVTAVAQARSDRPAAL